LNHPGLVIAEGFKIHCSSKVYIPMAAVQHVFMKIEAAVNTYKTV